MKSIPRIVKVSAVVLVGLAMAGCCVLPFGHGHGRGHYGSAEPGRYEPGHRQPMGADGNVPYRGSRGVY